MDNLAEDATLEGSMLDGVAEGPENVRAVVTTIRSFYDRQAHKFAGPSGNGGFLEDYVAEVRGEPIGCVVLVAYNDAGQTQQVVASYRPRISLVLFLHGSWAISSPALRLPITSMGRETPPPDPLAVCSAR